MSIGASTLSSHFEEIAKRLGVGESEFILLTLAGIKTESQFSFKVISATSLEVFIEDELYPYIGVYDVVDGVETPSYRMRWRTDGRELQEFLRSVRRLLRSDSCGNSPALIQRRI